jgi:hypothetical protein
MEAAFESKKMQVEKLKATRPIESTGEEITLSEDLKEYRKMQCSTLKLCGESIRT